MLLTPWCAGAGMQKQAMVFSVHPPSLGRLYSLTYTALFGCLVRNGECLEKGPAVPGADDGDWCNWHLFAELYTLDLFG